MATVFSTLVGNITGRKSIDTLHITSDLNFRYRNCSGNIKRMWKYLIDNDSKYKGDRWVFFKDKYLETNIINTGYIYYRWLYENADVVGLLVEIFSYYALKPKYPEI